MIVCWKKKKTSFSPLECASQPMPNSCAEVASYFTCKCYDMSLKVHYVTWSYVTMAVAKNDSYFGRKKNRCPFLSYLFFEE